MLTLLLVHGMRDVSNGIARAYCWLDVYGVVLVCLHFADDKSESSLNMYAIEIRLHHFRINILKHFFLLQTKNMTIDALPIWMD